MDEQGCAVDHRLAEPERQPGNLGPRIEADQHDGLRVRKVLNLARERPGRDRLRVEPDTHAADRGSQRVGHQPDRLVGQRGGGQHAAVAALEQLGRAGVRCVPGRGLQLAALPHQRRGQALVPHQRQRVEAAMIGEPAVVDGRVVAAPHPEDLAVSRVKLHVAAEGAASADARRPLQVPRASLEPVLAAGQRADRAQLDRVAAERRVEGVALQHADLAVAAAINRRECLVARRSRTGSACSGST